MIPKRSVRLELSGAGPVLGVLLPLRILPAAIKVDLIAKQWDIEGPRLALDKANGKCGRCRADLA